MSCPAPSGTPPARDGQLKTTLGKQNADLQVTRYGVNVQPFYVLLNPADSLAEPLAPPVAYQPDAADFAQFLDADSRSYRQPAPAAVAAARPTGGPAVRLRGAFPTNRLLAAGVNNVRRGVGVAARRIVFHASGYRPAVAGFYPWHLLHHPF